MRSLRGPRISEQQHLAGGIPGDRPRTEAGKVGRRYNRRGHAAVRRGKHALEHVLQRIAPSTPNADRFSRTGTTEDMERRTGGNGHRGNPEINFAGYEDESLYSLFRYRAQVPNHMLRDYYPQESWDDRTCLILTNPEISPEGLRKVKAFVRRGGRLVFLDPAAASRFTGESGEQGSSRPSRNGLV